MLTRRKKPQQFSSGVEFAVSAGLLLYRQQTPSLRRLVDDPQPPS
jgi:hypothetical protein